MLHEKAAQDRGQPARARAQPGSSRPCGRTGSARTRSAAPPARAWVDHDLIFCTRHGTRCPSGNLLRRFRTPLKPAGLPAHHRLHDLRHTAVQSLLLRARSPPGGQRRRRPRHPGGDDGALRPRRAPGAARTARRPRRVLPHRPRRARAEPRRGRRPGQPRPPGTARPAPSRRAARRAQAPPRRGSDAGHLAGRYGVSPSTINRALRGITGAAAEVGRGQQADRRGRARVGQVGASRSESGGGSRGRSGVGTGAGGEGPRVGGRSGTGAGSCAPEARPAQYPHKPLR